MPSPFPGMDPYLEGSTWMNFHGQLCAEIARQLTPKLRPRYVALLNERFVTEMPDGLAVTTSLSPDVGVVRSTSIRSQSGATGLAEAPLRIATAIPESFRQFSVEVRDRQERRLVTCIELLSPTNKRGQGREEYLARRARLLHSSAHLLEIDLLREGERLPMLEALPPAPYFIFVGRYEDRPQTSVWPVYLESAVPAVAVPLLPGDSDVGLDLQLAISNVYDQCGYDLNVDYARSPEIALDPQAASWSEELLRNAGLRS